MNQPSRQRGTGSLLWNFFASVNLTIVILLSLAAVSIIGTIVPQNGEPDFYYHKYGDLLYHVFSAFDIFDMYNSFWFRSLAVLLVINIIVCSADKLSATWKIIFPGKPVFRKNRLKSSAIHHHFLTPAAVNNLTDPYHAFMQRRYRHVIMENTENGFLLLAEKGRKARLGVYAVHLSVILLLIGSLIGSLFGFDGSVNIPEGESTDTIMLRNAKQPLKLDFQIRCDDFSVSFYDSGAPREFRSALTLLRNGKPVITKDIIVNDPLRHEGINIFQSSYGKLPPRDISLVFHDRKTGEEAVRKTVRIGEKIPLPQYGGEFVLTDFSDRHRTRGGGMGSAFTGILTLPDQGAIEVLIPYPFPKINFKKPAEVRKLDHLQTRAMTGPPEQISLSVTSRASGMTYTIDTKMGQPQPLPEGLGTFTLQRFQHSFQFKGHAIGDVLIGVHQQPDGTREEVVLPIKFSQFDRMRQGAIVVAVTDLRQDSSPSGLVVSVADFQEHYYTGLQVTRDPGVWVVYLGFIMMILGCYVTFFTAHQQVCIEAVQQEEQTAVTIYGTANKNKLNMQKSIDALAAQFSRLAADQS